MKFHPTVVRPFRTSHLSIKRWGAIAMLGALATFIWCTWTAVTIQPQPDAAEREDQVLTHPVTRASPVPLDEVLKSVDIDPFAPSRTRPYTRFRLPIAESDSGKSPDPHPSPSAELHLFGTVVLPSEGGLAVAAWSGGSPRLLKVGHTIGPFTLRAVGQRHAAFSSAEGQQLKIDLANSGS